VTEAAFLCKSFHFNIRGAKSIEMVLEHRSTLSHSTGYMLRHTSTKRALVNDIMFRSDLSIL